MRLKSWIIATSCLAALAASDVSAHDGVNHSIEEMSENIERSPAEARLYLLRANEWRVAGRYEDAMRDVAAARKRGATDAASLLEGRILLEAGRVTEAVALLKAHTVKRPKSMLGHWLLGRAQRLSGLTAPAATSYERAAELHTDVDLVAEQGAFLESLRDLDGAATAYRHGLERLESDVLRERLCHVELARGRGAEAVAAITPVVERATLKTRWLVLRAAAYEADGKSAKAKADRTRALRDVDAALTKRRSPMLLVERARVHAALGNHAAALADAEEAASRAPHFAAATSLRNELRRSK